jgi:hypothetical protein
MLALKETFGFDALERVIGMWLHHE